MQARKEINLDIEETVERLNDDYHEVIRLADGGDLMDALLVSIQNDYLPFLSKWINDCDNPADRMDLVLLAINDLNEIL